MIPYHRPMPLNDGKLLDAIEGILTLGMLTNGEWCRKVEDTIKSMYHSDYCLVFSSATQALKACLSYLPNSIETSAFEWSSPFLNESRNVYYDDIYITTWFINQVSSPFQFVPCHVFGSVLDLPESDDWVIFDGAHALGSKIRNIGEATVFSLAATKLVTGCEGGVLITNNKEFHDYLKDHRDKCSRLSEVHAAIALYTLDKLEEMLAWKLKVAKHYQRRIPGNFQLIPFNTNHNTIGFLNTCHLLIPTTEFEFRQYYEPLSPLKNAKWVHENIVCLPSFYGCPYEYITEEILKINE